MTTMGKWRHLSRCSTTDGHFVIAAIDHRANLLETLNKHAATPFDDARFTAYKQDVMRALLPNASAVLTDPAYGIGYGVPHATISGQKGLLAPIEVTDYGLHPSQRPIQMIPHWSVRKIKMIGGDGVKLLLPYNPNALNIDDVHAFVQSIMADCATYDIPFFLEPIPYALDPGATLSNAERLEISISMCRNFSKMGADVLKLPFPLDHKQSQDEAEWQDACLAINEACTVPWALLSAGVDFETFAKQSEVACKAGASGVIVGRAVWGESVSLHGEALAAFLTETAARRMHQLAKICAESASPWYDRVEHPPHHTHWYETYQPDTRS